MLKLKVCFSRTAGHLTTLKIFWGIHKLKTFFVIILKCYLPSSLSYCLEKHSGFFQRLSNMWYHNSLNAEAHWGFSCPLLSQTLKRIAKMWNNITFLNNLCLEMIAIFIKTLSILTFYELAYIFVGLFFVLIYNMANVYRYNYQS